MTIMFWILSGAIMLPVHPYQISSKESVIAAPGDDAILPCTFTAVDSQNITNLIINWQHQDKVVHSFYLGKDQLERQGQAYRERTHLFMKEVLKGNASLALKDVRPHHDGEYTCDVTHERGATKHNVQLTVAAPYDDPVLAVYYNCDNVVVTMSSSKGFPEPTVSWNPPVGTSITTTELDTNGRYIVHSNLTLILNTTETVAAKMKLKEFSQDIIREITLHPQPSMIWTLPLLAFMTTHF
ncbi:CD276 antigen-like isoform X1 [Astyanax mexicanus]|uniref:CD276 antigen-like isoform X1 n=1 Tax=Astyanax mexicanus TaxID=7994 RepID=UPI0020CB377A|nr:CD276 antigen-like isoform X1 [Astyanax mexicanus]